MNLEEKQELLKILCEIQDKKTAPIELSIGWTDEAGFTHDDIVITMAPPKIINDLIEKGYLLSIADYGARVLTKSMSPERVNKMYRTKTWTPVEIDTKDDVLYSKREDAEREKARLEEMQPENKYEIEEVGQ